LKISAPDDEVNLEKVLRHMESEFNGITLKSKASGKELVPLEVVLDISIEIAAGIAAAVLIKFLERLWQELKQKGLTPQTYESDVVQSSAARYLLSNGVTNFRLLERKDKGPYVEFVFKDERGSKHFIVITSFDLKILRYKKRGRE
jgi:hypothetical protein